MVEHCSGHWVSQALGKPWEEVNSAPTRKTAGRRRLWELRADYHCSICGTCLSLSDLRRVAGKAGFRVDPAASEHEVHSTFVRFASAPGRVAKAMQKVLDRKHRSAIERCRALGSEAELRAFWAASLAKGDVSGPYWALMTHPLASERLMVDLFGDVHMLSHLLGASNRADIRRLRFLEREREALSEELAGSRRRSAERDAELRQLHDERNREAESARATETRLGRGAGTGARAHRRRPRSGPSKRENDALAARLEKAVRDHEVECRRRAGPRARGLRAAERPRGRPHRASRPRRGMRGTRAHARFPGSGRGSRRGRPFPDPRSRWPADRVRRGAGEPHRSLPEPHRTVQRRAHPPRRRRRRQHRTARSRPRPGGRGALSGGLREPRRVSSGQAVLQAQAKALRGPSQRGAPPRSWEGFAKSPRTPARAEVASAVSSAETGAGMRRGEIHYPPIHPPTHSEQERRSEMKHTLATRIGKHRLAAAFLAALMPRAARRPGRHGRGQPLLLSPTLPHRAHPREVHRGDRDRGQCRLRQEGNDRQDQGRRREQPRGRGADRGHRTA